MATWMEIVLFNASSATLLAVVVALIARRIKRAPIAHALWLIVLLKLISPPVFEVGLVPTFDQVRDRFDMGVAAGPNDANAPVGVHHTNNEERLRPVAQSTNHADNTLQRNHQNSTSASGVHSALYMDSDRPAPMQSSLQRVVPILPVLAAFGTLLLLGLSMLRIARFRRSLRGAPEAPPALQARAARLAHSFGIKRTPRIRIVPGRLPPSLWPRPGSCEILLPAALLTRLSDQECDTLLAHELAHVQRRDHWLRPLELLVVALYWWHPVAWWARRNLRIAEEQACDALVVRKLANQSRVYAESLLKTVEFLARQDPAVPLLATGAIGTARLKERVTMILKKKTPDPLPKLLRPFVSTLR